MMKARILLMASLMGLGSTLVADEASARGRYERGRTLFRAKCAPCLAMGWRWAPKTLDWAKLELMKKARTWSPAQVCTWMRSNRKRLAGAPCYPGYLSQAQKLDILYYIKERARGQVKQVPVLRRSSFKRKPLRLRCNVAARRATALKRHKNMLMMRKYRRRTHRWRRPRYQPRRRARRGSRR